ncbi:hypothetical protein [Streptomyces sp. NBC_00425]|uniref:hypothetical protein n=1 Tax=Streptomyces sp. NBC_00425 TaxID=2975740 RepID=UPI002E249843
MGPQDARERLPLRDFTAQRRPEGLTARPFEPDPPIALLTTAHDRRVDPLRAGQALERVWLVTTVRPARFRDGSAVEWDDLRDTLVTSCDGSAHPQLLIRLGHGPQGPATPRRAAGREITGTLDAHPRGPD